MTEHLYQTDSYLREFDAVVTGVDGQAVALDRTSFYPGGGGQPHDAGLLTWDEGSSAVTKVKKQGRLYLGIVPFRRNYAATGSYQVKIQTER